jgi:hypothetical protein
LGSLDHTVLGVIGAVALYRWYLLAVVIDPARIASYRFARLAIGAPLYGNPEAMATNALRVALFCFFAACVVTLAARYGWNRVLASCYLVIVLVLGVVYAL